MKLHQLRSLIVVAEKGSIREASRVLHITQPAISKALSDLETELGAPLLLRFNNGVQLTSYGQSLIRHARAIELEMQHAKEDIDNLLGIARGIVTVGVTPATATGPFAEALRRFMRMHPHVSVNVRELRPVQLQEGLADGSIDLGLVSRIGQPVEPRFHWEELYTIPTALAVRLDHPLRGKKSLRELAQSAWLSWDGFDDATSLVGSLFSANGVEPPPSVLRCTSTTLYVEMATTTDLISMWSALPFHMPEYNAKLRQVQISEPLPNMTIGLICRDLALATSVARALVDMIRECSVNMGATFRRAGAIPRVKPPKGGD